MCLAIPGRVVKFVDERNGLATVDVAGVLRTVNVGLLDGPAPGDWVLIHVGFALSKVDAGEALAICDDGVEVMTDLVGAVEPGDELLVHAGVALMRLA